MYLLIYVLTYSQIPLDGPDQTLLETWVVIMIITDIFKVA